MDNKAVARATVCPSTFHTSVTAIHMQLHANWSAAGRASGSLPPAPHAACPAPPRMCGPHALRHAAVCHALHALHRSPGSLGGDTTGLPSRATFHGSLRPRARCTTAAQALTAQAQEDPSSILRLTGDLPIRECIMEVLQQLDRSSCLVLQAPPGAGKTTTVPLALLLHSPGYLPPGSKILVLEPRRVAAKAAARRMASLLGERVGETVGYRVKLDTRVGPTTRVEVITSGIMIRMLQQDPGLQGVGAVLFDEFHERNMDSDLALTLSLDAQQLARPDLRLVVMSATLGGGLAPRLSALMAPPPAPAAAGAAGAAAAGAAGAGAAGAAAAGAAGAAAAGAAGAAAARAAKDSDSVLSGAVPVVVSEGRSYPVAVKYLGLPGRQRGELEQRVAEAVMEAVKKPDAGDVLVFLPGVGEIRGVERLLLRLLPRGSPLQLLQLHGNQAPAQQDAAVLGGGRGSGGARRVILATPIAESSITIDGVCSVVDSGLRRSPAYDTLTGVNRLRLTRISEASAEQRAGRAGRTAPGTAYRLWDQQDSLQQATPPEIGEADLAPLVLELAMWGTTDGSGLSWLDPPEPERIKVAQDLLCHLGALDEQGRPTDEGRRMASFGVHPRFAHMVLRGAALGAGELAAVLAALLSERDVLRGSAEASASADVALRLDHLALVAGTEQRGGRGSEASEASAAARVLLTARSILGQLQASAERQQQRQLQRQGGEGSSDGDDEGDDGDEGEGGDGEGDVRAPRGPSSVAAARDFTTAWTLQRAKEGLVGALVATAYPDRIAKQENGNRFLMADGRVARLPIPNDPLAVAAQYLAIAELGNSGDPRRNDSIYAAAALTSTAVSRYLSDTLLTQRRVVAWASASKRVVAVEQQRLGALVVQERAVPVTDKEALPALVKGFKEMGGLQHFGLPKQLESFRQRVCWLRQRLMEGGAGAGAKQFPDLSDEALIASAPQWLGQHVAGVRTKADFLKMDWQAILYDMVGGWSRVQEVEAQAMANVVMPTGTKVLIDYSKAAPSISIKIQEVFGMSSTPRLAGGTVPVVMELLSPAGKPIQVTSDLAGFWQSSYRLVWRDMKGRYPRHFWPENPAEAEATKMTKAGMAREALKQEQREQQQESSSGQQLQKPAEKAKSKKKGR